MTSTALHRVWTQIRPKSEERRAARDMREATTYAEWRSAARRYDLATGGEAWRQKDASPHYDHEVIRARLDELEDLRGRGDDHRLLFSLNEGLHGDFGSMGREVLYRKAASGTKYLIVRYVDAVVEALEHLATETRSGIPRHAKLAFFRRASLCFGHTALMLSGSGTLFFFHVGVLRALIGEKLLPSILSGSSGGALVASIVGTRDPESQLDALVSDTFRHFLRERRSFLPSSVHRVVLERRQEILEALMPDLTFEQAYERSGVAINVSVAPTDLHQRSRLLNAVTSPHVYVREAVLASTAFPGLFPPVTLMAESADGEREPYLPARQWVDGSVSDDLPAKRLARLFGVNHYVVSQTNPHVLPFLTDSKTAVTALSVLRRTARRTLRELVNGTAAVALPAMSFSRQMTRATTMFLSIINQDYLGNINILPDLPPPNPLRMLDFRSEEEARELVHAGQHATWPRIEMIRTQTKISRTLDRLLAAA